MSATASLPAQAARPDLPANAPLERLDRLARALPGLHRARHAGPALASVGSVETLIAERRPAEPVFLIEPARLRQAARRFSAFPGRALYAVKCNPHPFVLETLFEAGIRDFDVASLDEVRLVDGLFGKAAGQFFNNPAKTRPAIRSAAGEFGLRFYTADCAGEVDKILDEAPNHDDLIIAARLATPGKDARYALSTKFGASPDATVELLRLIERRGVRAGISFHVGSQCLAPEAFGAALALTRKVIRRAGVPLSVLNVGGGFPAPYPGDHPKALEHYFSEVIFGRKGLDLPAGCMLMCEPGRSLVAEAGTLLVQVVMRRERTIFLNDGVFGTLQELGHPKERRPTRLLREGPAPSARTAEFKVFGPTCDSNDVLGAPFVLPEDVREGDWIEVGMMGAYSLSMRTRFNGFFTDDVVALEA